MRSINNLVTKLKPKINVVIYQLIIIDQDELFLLELYN